MWRNGDSSNNKKTWINDSDKQLKEQTQPYEETTSITITFRLQESMPVKEKSNWIVFRSKGFYLLYVGNGF